MCDPTSGWLFEQAEQTGGEDAEPTAVSRR